MTLKLAVFLAIASALLSQTTLASESNPHMNHIAIFGGATTASGETHATVGLDYERRLPLVDQVFGLGPIADFSFASEVQTILAIGLFMHPYMGSKITLAPGLEIVLGHSEFVFRAGFAYDFHITGDISLSPTFNADIVSGHVAWVYGLSLGYGF